MEIYTDTIIEHTIFIPYDEQLIIRDCTVKIERNAHIICLGKFEASNVNFEPIEDTFGAIAIMSYNKESKISQCIFKKGSGIPRKHFQKLPIFWEIFPLEDWEYNDNEETRHTILKTKIAGALICIDTKIDHCTFEDCHSEDCGGSLYAVRSTIKNSNFINSHSKGDCGAICGKESNIIRCSFIDCIADDSGGALGRYDLKIDDCFFIRCHAKEDGGAIFCSEQGSIHHSKFINCTARSGGAIAGTSHVSHCIFKNCSVKDRGGAIELYSRVACISDSKFMNCYVINKDAPSDVIFCCCGVTFIMDCMFKNTQESCKVFIYGCSFKVFWSKFTSKCQLQKPIDGCCEIKVMACSYNSKNVIWKNI
ncbi:hypothetical protein [Sulfurospirillum sp. UCH001]|uniref:hypothetical protein n=1 Tax=Sulfurospirillum sp. UCH001 TaxID=1581011 RepID=UPI0008372C10|nr:hypothetical protein [Sulfurospirillum sp. UCH001]